VRSQQDRETIRRHAEHDLAAISQRLNSGKPRGVRETHMLSEIANNLTSILDNLDRIEERRKIGFDTNINKDVEASHSGHGIRMTAVNGYDDDDDINSDMAKARAIYNAFNNDVENEESCRRHHGMKAEAANDVQDYTPHGPGTDATHPAGVGPVRGIRRY